MMEFFKIKLFEEAYCQQKKNNTKKLRKNFILKTFTQEKNLKVNIF